MSKLDQGSDLEEGEVVQVQHYLSFILTDCEHELGNFSFPISAKNPTQKANQTQTEKEILLLPKFRQ